MNLFTTTRGSPQNPAVLCLHGLLGSSRTLIKLATELEKKFFVILPDQKGHGHSPHAASNEEYTLKSLAADVIDVLDHYKISKTHLIGHSMGARVSISAASSYPDRVISLSVLDAGLQINSSAHISVRDIVEPLPQSFSSKSEADEFLSRYPASMKQFLMSNLRTIGHEVKWIFDLNGIRSHLLTQIGIDQREAYKLIHCPILILRGENSDHLRPYEVEEMLRLNVHAKSNTISNAGHWLHTDNFEETKNNLLSFLEEQR